MAGLLALGFSSGMPLLLTSKTLQAWMTVEGVDLKTIGLFSLVGLPYSLKFLWSPIIDRYAPPFLGRRRGWIVLAQAGLAIAIFLMSLVSPTRGIERLAAFAILVAFLSASQDIAVDAYRADVLEPAEMGAGAALYVLGYRVAMLAAGSAALILADHLPWAWVYRLSAAAMLCVTAASFLSPEPAYRERPPETLSAAVVEPFVDFFKRSGWQGAAILGFIVIYKFGDYLIGNMTTPFLLKTGFTQTDVGAIQGGIGLFATIVGALAGGAMVSRLGINRSLWVFGALQAVSNLGYYVLSVHPGYWLMVGAIIIENFCGGLVTAGFVAFMMCLCSPRYSAVQYALLTSLMALSRDILVSPAGVIAKGTGWPLFFLITIAAAVPGMALLPVFAPWNKPLPLGAAQHEGAEKAEVAA
ncbi:MAG: AmpG family muropeptide MFS transporter [Elusimicrobia bacterium]|nr:AmpG family muropeptide MFS transporter [Elusimicrobiota bacterium]